MLRTLSSSTHAFSLILCTCLTLSAVGCGGEVDTGDGAGAGAGAGSGAGSSQNGGSGNAQYLLGDCGPGFSVQQASAAKPCKYFIGTTCYSTQKEACACACPRDQGDLLCIIDGNSFLSGTDAYGIFCVPE